MVIDTSAVVAILQDEPERSRFNLAIEEASSRMMSAATWVESSIVLEARYGGGGLAGFDLFVDRAAIEVVPVDREQARVARGAFTRFGQGRHPAGLNYGDCFSYALATVLGETLLYKGEDFQKTDVAPSVLPSAD
jgi:ribonuclease VapC